MISDVLNEENWAHFPYVEALAAFNPVPRSKRIYVNCPHCKERSGYVLLGDDRIRCNRENNCGVETLVLAVLVGQLDAPKGEQFKTAVRRFCELSNVPYPEEEEVNERTREFKARRDALSTVWACVSDAMLGAHDPFSNANSALAYLTSRGFDAEFCAANFGFLDKPDSLAALLDTDSLCKMGFMSERTGAYVVGWQKRIIVPGKDANGRLVGLIGRSIDPNCDPREKYRYTNNYSPATFGGFGLDTAKTHKQIVLVEGTMDVLKARMYGQNNLVAAGTNSFSVDNLLALRNHGIREVVCAFDFDNAGNKGRRSLLDAHLQSGETPDVYTLDRFAAKDPDEFLSSPERAAEFRELCDRSIHLLRWGARELATEYKVPGPDARTFEFGLAATEFGKEKATDRRTELRIKTQFLSEVAILSGLSPEDLFGMRDEHVAKIQEKQRKEGATHDTEKALSEFRQSGNVETYLDRLAQIATRYAPGGNEASTLATEYKSIIPVGESAFISVETSIRQMATREYLGMPQRSLHTLDVLLSGLRGYILLAGDTNVGKTILLGQFALDVLRFNMDACCLFVSLEMSREDIVRRMWSHLAEVSLQGLFHAHTSPPGLFAERVDAARDDFLLNYDPRLAVWNPRETRTNQVTGNLIIQEAIALKLKTGAKRVFIVGDYLDVLDPPVGYEEAHPLEQDKARVETVLNIRDTFGDDGAQIWASEARKRDTKNAVARLSLNDIIGSTRKAYSASAVLLWNKFSNRDLFNNFDFNANGELFAMREGYDVPDKDLDKSETKKAVAKIRVAMANLGVDFGVLEVAKVRDGGTKGEVPITVHYRRNLITEGLL